MKNIHLIPTENSSRLSFDKDGVLKLNRLQWKKETQNIYITSDEEIKEGDWIFDIVTKRIEIAKFNHNDLKRDWKKIILTTDLELQKDGVQAIDDEFLKWFVKNPTCEFVEIVDDWNSPRIDAYEYRVIIPNLEMSIKEREPHSFCETPNEKCSMNYCDENGCQNRKRNLVPKEDPDYTALLKPVGTKQETLEESAKNYATNHGIMAYVFPEKQESFMDGAKWQMKRSYSDEEVLNILNEFCDNFYENSIRKDVIEKWFEQFKKK
jgi:hypothetical protein